MLQDKAGFGSGPAAAVGAAARSDPKVAVLVVHGVAAKIGDQGSSSAQVITDFTDIPGRRNTQGRLLAARNNERAVQDRRHRGSKAGPNV